MKYCFVVAPQNKGGILNRICSEIAKTIPDSGISYSYKVLPSAEHYFLSHYTFMPYAMEQTSAKLTVFFTHDKGNVSEYVKYFNRCENVIAESPEGQELLLSLGVRPELLHMVPEGGDNVAFRPHQRTENGTVIVASTNYGDGRKNPELVHAVRSLLPHRKFDILGESWGVPNVPYSAYPAHFADGTVFLSCAKLEGGGPNALIEAMHANLVPVVSDTGNARQYIQHGHNGFIFSHGTSAEEVARLVERAYSFKPQEKVPFNDVWRTVTQFTWENYATQMREIILGDYSHTTANGDYACKSA